MSCATSLPQMPHVLIGDLISHVLVFPLWMPKGHSTFMSSLCGLSLIRRVFIDCVLAMSVCHLPHPNQGMPTVHRPLLFCMWNSTVLLKLCTLNSSVRTGLSRAPLSPAPPVVWIPSDFTPPGRLQFFGKHVYLALCGAFLIVFQGEGSLFCWSELKTLSSPWIPKGSSFASLSLPTYPSDTPTSGFGSYRVSLFWGPLWGRVGEKLLCFVFFWIHTIS